MKKGDKVYWIDPKNGDKKSGVLEALNQVVAEVSAEPFIWGNAKFKDISKPMWDIKGDDGKSYAFEEKDLQTFPFEN